MIPTISALQMTSVNHIDENLETAARLIAQAAKAGSTMAVLPEMFSTLSVENGHICAREPLGEGPLQNFLSTQAKQHNIWVIGGTIPIASDDDTRIHAACMVYDNHGHFVTRYDKIHLYDVTLENGKQVFHESAKTIHGNTPIVFDSPLGKIGLAVCYDLRFAELFQILTKKGAQIIVIPSAFVHHTGEAHWEVLCRARAIENQVYIVAANQTGEHHGGRKSYGNSMVIDPWGKVISALGDGEGIVTGSIDLQYLKKVRECIPMSCHRRL